MRKVLLLVLGLMPPVACAAPEPLDLTLPPMLYAVPGVPTSVYWDNLVVTQTPEAYRFTVTCDIGESGERCWSVTPTDGDVGDHTFAVAVADADGNAIESAETVLRVAPANAGEGKSIKLMIIGDSLTHGTWYSNEIARLLTEPGNPTWKMLGTHKPGQAAEGVAHEGYGGWSWYRFANHYEPEPDGTYKNVSPFVFLGEDDQPKLDLQRYFDENFAGEKPDYVTFLLGINDCFGAPPDDREGIDARVNAMFVHAEKLLAAFREVCPDAELGVCLTTPGNSRQEAFYANYKEKYTRWGWKRIQHRLVQREIELLGGRQADNIHIVPTELNLDPVDGYPENNGVHPNRNGYAQIGQSIYAWLKSRLAAGE